MKMWWRLRAEGLWYAKSTRQESKTCYCVLLFVAARTVYSLVKPVNVICD